MKNIKIKQSPTRINQKRLVKMFQDIKRLKSDDSRFCFLIGAGASKSSGIKTGWELAQKWYNELKEDLDKEDFDRWKKSITLDEKKMGEYYPHIYKKRYKICPEIGYEEFKRMMEPIEPGLGYVILSQILAEEKHNFVITTNFDYLIEDAVRMYTATKPFSAGHETLAEFISTQTERPTIIKVHRDLFLHPFNGDKETQNLKEEWKKALTPILKNFNLLVLGYGGNDGSLMDYLKEIGSEGRKPIYWCIRNESDLNNKINNLLTEKDFIVTIDGFDELMYALNNVLDYKTFDNLEDSENHQFVQAAKKRISSLNDKRGELLENLKSNKEEISKDTKEIFTGSYSYNLDAYVEKDVIKKEAIYKEGLEKYPNDANLVGSYATFLYEIDKDNDKAEDNFKKAIELKPNDAIILGNYAIFLNKIRKENNKAEEYFVKSFESDPKYVNNIGNYANFLSATRGNYDKAEEYYIMANELDLKNATNLSNYASFLSNIRGDYDNAEEYYKKSILLKPNNPDTLGNYAIFLFNYRKDKDKAEEYYNKAITLNPSDSDLFGNYANFLFSIRLDYDKAKEYYKKSIKLNPENSVVIGNYANLLTYHFKDYDQAEENYKKAIVLDSDNSVIIGNYSNFLNNVRQDFDKAEEYFKKSIELDSTDAYNRGNYAHHLIISKQDFTNAETNIDKSFTLLKNGMENLRAELWFYRYAHYKKYIIEAEKELVQLVSQNVKSLGWNFQSHVEIARANKHPNVKRLQEFADAFSK